MRQKSKSTVSSTCVKTQTLFRLKDSPVLWPRSDSMMRARQGEAGSSSPGGSSYAPAAGGTGPGGGFAAAGLAGPPCTSPPWRGSTAFAAAAWPEAAEASSSSRTGASNAVSRPK